MIFRCCSIIILSIIIEERRPLSEPYYSTIDYFDMTLFRNEGVIAEATVEVSSNGVLGALTVKGESA